MEPTLANSNFNILIVDDNPKNIQVLGSVLREEGYNLEFAIDGHAALDWVKDENFDLILLDIMMPEISGYEVCKAIKEDENTKKIPVVFLSAKSDLDSLVKGFELGAVDYITKPFNTQELLLRVGTHIELQHRRKQLELTNAQKDKLFAIIAHDIKNPFTSLLTSFELLEGIIDRLDKEKIKERLVGMKDEIEAIVHTSNNLLQWGKYQINGFSPNNEELDVADLIDSNLIGFKQILEDKKLKLDMEINSKAPIYFDKEQFGILFRNLLSNAIKFSHVEGAIKISALAQGRGEIIEIKDFGVGIPQKLLENLLKLNVRTSRKGTKNEHGAGLGLLLVNEIIQANNAYMKIRSKEGEGTTVSVTLPRNKS